MYLNDEQITHDDERWGRLNIIDELKYSGWNFKDYRCVTNDDLYYFAWLCRAALKMIEFECRNFEKEDIEE